MDRVGVQNHNPNTSTGPNPNHEGFDISIRSITHSLRSSHALHLWKMGKLRYQEQSGFSCIVPHRSRFGVCFFAHNTMGTRAYDGTGDGEAMYTVAIFSSGVLYWWLLRIASHACLQRKLKLFFTTGLIVAVSCEIINQSMFTRGVKQRLHSKVQTSSG